MSGPDASLRAKGARLVDQLRRDELPAYTEARERKCRTGDGPYCTDHGLLCSGVGRVPCDPLDVAALLALTEDGEAAEEAMSCLDVRRESQVKFAPHMSGKVPLSPWLSRVAQFAAKLPPKRVGRNQCDGCARGLPVVDGTHPGLKAWDGQICTADRYPIHDTPAQRWLMVVAAEAVARECVHDCPCDLRGGHCTCGLREIVEAIDACRTWIAEPTPERRSSWAEASVETPEWVPWFGVPAQAALLAAADVIGPDRVREIASRAIREAVRGG